MAGWFEQSIANMAMCGEGISGGVWHLCGFAIYHVWEELFNCCLISKPCR